MIRELRTGRRRFASGTSRTVTFSADDLVPTSVTAPARLRARQMAHLLAAFYGKRVTALALPPAQLRSRSLPERLRRTEDGEELLSLRSVLAYHAARLPRDESGRECDPADHELAEIVRGLQRKGLLAFATHEPGSHGDGEQGHGERCRGKGDAEETLATVGTLGLPSSLGSYLSGALITNAHFFVLLAGEVDSYHVPVGQAVGLTARGGVIGGPPTAARGALLCTRRGWHVGQVGPRDLTAVLPGGGAVHGTSDACLFTRGPTLPGARTPEEPTSLEVTLVGRWAVAMADGGNRPVPHGGIVLRLPQATDPATLEALRRGAPVRYHLEGLADLRAAVQAGPRLVEEGHTCLGEDSFDNEEFYVQGSAEPTVPTMFPADVSSTAAARLGVGVGADGRLLVAAVEGQSALHSSGSAESTGCTLLELAELLIELGAREAVNLDGGGSVQVSAGTGTFLRPADSRGVAGASFERPVPTALVFR